MAEEFQRKHTLECDESLSPRVARWFSQMEEVRKKLLKTIAKMSDDELDFTPDERNVETIGTLLLHIAAVEWSWIFEDIDGKEMSFEEWKFAFPLRPEVTLPQLKGQGKKFYINRLNNVRHDVYQRLLKLNDSDVDRMVGTEEKYSIEWILFHIIEHEITHLGQIILLSRLFRLTKRN